CPTLLLWGAQDHQTPVSDAFDYARRLRAELRVIPDCGHLLIAERPDACAHALNEVAERADAPAPAAAAWRSSSRYPMAARGVAQPGSALRSGRRGPQFKSGHPDKARGHPGIATTPPPLS